MIDPALPLTVTGPATNKTVKSITLGGGGAATTLDLNATPTDIVFETSALRIDTAGGSKLDLRDNLLVVDYDGVSPLN